VLGFGLAACSDVTVAPTSSLAPTTSTFAKGTNGVPIPGRYIVRFRDDEQDVDGRARELAVKHAGTVRRVYKAALKGMTLELSDAAVAALRADPSVLSVEQDQTVSISTTQTGATWGLDRIDQRTLPLNGTYIYNADGTGVTVYIIDTGINFTHTEYNGRAFTGIDEVTAGGTAADCNGHGSHVSGTVGGTVYGVAKKVKLVAVRVLDCSGSGTISGVIAGVDWVTAQKRASPTVPSAANMSLGGGLSPTLNQAVENSITAGVVYAVAAGNDGLDACSYSPASAPNAITVGATDINDGFAYFSNTGSCVHINAPGVNITSAWMGTTTATNTISGTSMASPHVAGTIALYLQVNPTATAAQVDAALKANASTTPVPAGTTNKFIYSAFITATPQPPVANFTSTCSALTCNFDASSTTAQANATYSWTFGDATTGTGVTTSHTYAAAGTYSVTLTVTDGIGTSTKTQTVTVSNTVAAPVANFTYSCTGLTCTFTNTSTNATAYSWNFGDATPAVTTANATHTYSVAGTYTVVLTATNSGTVASTKSQAVTVTAPPPCVGGEGDC
jgi:subtilisin family serine protease